MAIEPPPDSELFRVLLADLHDELPGRIERQKLLWRWESDAYAGGQLMIPGGHTAYMAYVELRQAFISGYFLSTVLLAQCLVENVLASQIGIDAMSAQIKGSDHETLRDRPTAKECIAASRRLGVLDATDEVDLFRLAEARNSLAHFRPVSDATNLDRRSINERRHAELVCSDDARFAMNVVVRIMAKPAFLLGGETTGYTE